MVRMIIFLSLLVTGSNIFAQFTYSPNPFSITAPNPGETVKVDLDMTVANDTTYRIYWKMEFPESFKQGWQIQLCDLNLCYDYNAPMSANTNSKANVMGMGTHTFEIGFLPNNIEGNGQVILTLYGNKEFTTLVKTIPISLVAGSSSSNDINGAGLKVFPNPTNNYFQIYNGNHIKKIEIYNVVGSKVKTFNNTPNAQHDISELRRGPYIIKLFDARNRAVKTIRLIKNTEGV